MHSWLLWEGIRAYHSQAAQAEDAVSIHSLKRKAAERAAKSLWCGNGCTNMDSWCTVYKQGFLGRANY